MNTLTDDQVESIASIAFEHGLHGYGIKNLIKFYDQVYHVVGPIWHDIESAPKDGTRILVDVAGHVVITKWNPNLSRWVLESPSLAHLQIDPIIWTHVPIAPSIEVLTNDQIKQLAHRECYRYMHGDDPTYTFDEHTLIEFTNKLTELINRNTNE